MSFSHLQSLLNSFRCAVRGLLLCLKTQRNFRLELIIALFILLYKKGDAIERWFFGLFRPKKEGDTDQKAAGGAADAGGTAEANEKAKKKRSAARARNIPPSRGARPASEK